MKTKELTITAWVIIAHILMMLVAGILLIYTFDFPDILRAPMETTLERFYHNRAFTVPAYYLFTLTGISFMLLVLLLFKTLDLRDSTPAFTAIFFGVLFGLTSSLGFVRWPFLMRLLGERLVEGNPAELPILRLVYDAFHTYAGVSVGEHFAFWFEFLWMFLFATSLRAKPEVVPSYLAATGQVLGMGMLVYSLEQFGGLFTVLGPLNMLVHTAQLAWLLALAFCLFNAGGTLRGKLSPLQKGAALCFFLILILISLT